MRATYTSTNAALDGTFVASGSRTDSAVIGSGQAGYNFLVAPHIMLGVEADIDASSAKSTVTSPDGSNSFASKLDDFGTVRGRAGFAQDNWLFYGTGGFASSHGSVTHTQIAAVATVPPIPAAAGALESAPNTRTGWAAGAGIEWGITQNWTARAEYLYLDPRPRLGDLGVPAVQPPANELAQHEHRAVRRELQIRQSGYREVLRPWRQR
jgi:outer membrane immunogenic protein